MACCFKQGLPTCAEGDDVCVVTVTNLFAVRRADVAGGADDADVELRNVHRVTNLRELVELGKAVFVLEIEAGQTGAFLGNLRVDCG